MIVRNQGIMCSGDIQDALFQTSSNALLKSRVCQQVLGDSCPIPKRSTLQEDGSDFFIVTGVNLFLLREFISTKWKLVQLRMRS